MSWRRCWSSFCFATGNRIVFGCDNIGLFCDSNGDGDGDGDDDDDGGDKDNDDDDDNNNDDDDDNDDDDVGSDNESLLVDDFNNDVDDAEDNDDNDESTDTVNRELKPLSESDRVTNCGAVSDEFVLLQS